MWRICTTKIAKGYVLKEGLYVCVDEIHWVSTSDKSGITITKIAHATVVFNHEDTKDFLRVEIIPKETLKLEIEGFEEMVRSSEYAKKHFR